MTRIYHGYTGIKANANLDALIAQLAAEVATRASVDTSTLAHIDSAVAWFTTPTPVTGNAALYRQAGPQVVVFEGDSITAGYGLLAGQDWPSQLFALSSYYNTFTKQNVATSSITLQSTTVGPQPNIRDRAAALVDALRSATTEQDLCVLFAGTNDIANASASGATAAAAVWAWADARRAAGNKVAVCTMISRNTINTTERAAFNAEMRANWASHADGLIDLAANAAFSADNAYLSGTYYQDGVHPTAAGAAIIATIADPVIRALTAGAATVRWRAATLAAHQLTAGTLPVGRLAGAYTGITDVGPTVKAGTALAGTWVSIATYATFGHKDQALSATKYALIQSADGNTTTLNSGLEVYLAVNGAGKARVIAAGLIADTDLLLATGVPLLSQGGTGVPVLNARAPGSKLILQESFNASAANFAIGLDTLFLWFGAPTNAFGQGFKWYGGATVAMQLLSNGDLTLAGKVGFNGAAALTKPSITGSKAANAALASLLTQLATYGLITDSTT